MNSTNWKFGLAAIAGSRSRTRDRRTVICISSSWARTDQLRTAALLLLATALFSPRVSATTMVSASATCYPIAAPNTGTNSSSTTPGVAAAVSIAGQCETSAFSDFSTIKMGSDTLSSTTYGGSVNVDLYIGFYLTNPNVSGVVPISLSFPVVYDITISATNTPGFSGAGLNMTTDFFNSFGFDTSNDQFVNNRCPTPLSTLPRCNGRYQGTFAIPVLQANYNGYSEFRLHVGGYSQNLALLDALHTISFGPVVLPDGVTFAYDPGVTGNPLNLQIAPTAVPEPAAALLVIPALLALVISRGKRRA